VATKFNLLPVRAGSSKELKKISGIFQKLTIALFFVLILICGIGGGFLFYLTREVNNLNQEQDNLRKSIANLESTEQGLVLIKDRADKIQTLMTMRGELDSFLKQKEITDNLPPDVYFRGSKVSGDTSKLELLSARSRPLTELLENLVRNNKFPNLVLNGIDLDPFSGYGIVLQVF
jgi:Tfp pilus assembly protein PilN